jgi:aconitate hydratase
LPPYFADLSFDLPEFHPIEKAYCLALFGDSITTDHISPAGNIAANSPAGRYLIERGVVRADFNTYGARRGHDEVMVRGTFANVRIKNKMLKGIVIVVVSNHRKHHILSTSQRRNKLPSSTPLLSTSSWGCLWSSSEGQSMGQDPLAIGQPKAPTSRV